MSLEQSRPCRFDDELAAIIAGGQSSADETARHDLFQALSRLERRALIGGALDQTLRNIAEARFLAGILRDSMRPSRPARLRTVLRACGQPVPRPRAPADSAPV